MSDIKLHTPIDWPEWWRESHRYFLEGIPYFGTQCKVIKHVCRVLKLRDSASFDAAWANTGSPIDKCRDIAINVRKIMRPYIQWPNDYFFPDDKTCLLFGSIPGVGFDSEDPIEDARVFFNLKGIKDNCFDIYETIDDGLFKDFTELVISGRIKAGKHNPRRMIW